MESTVHITEVETVEVKVYVGLKRMYTDTVYTLEDVYNLLQQYVDEQSWCFSVTPTRYIYKQGWENGVIIGLINYPRFPATPETILKHALLIGEILMRELHQYRVTVVTNTKTYMLSNLSLT